MIGKRLKELRERNGLTQVEISKYLNTQQASYSKYENDKRTPDYETLIKLSKLYKTSIDYILGNSIENESELSKIEKQLTKEEKKRLIEIIKLTFPNIKKDAE